MKVLEAIQRSSDFLERKGVESPRLNAELLLGHTLGVQRMRLYLDFDRILGPDQVDQLRRVVARRGKREPLQQITGEACFCGLEFTVNPQVLTPRPETELLAELAWKRLEKIQSANPSSTLSALDFGTGSGCLAITISVHCPTAALTAIDVSPPALQVAGTNIARHQVADRVRLLESDGFSGVPDCFDLIVANPPYIPTAILQTLQPEVRDFEPSLALDGGPDGLEFYRRLAVEAPRHLKPGGILAMEFGDGQAAAVTDLFLSQNWIVEPPTQDYTGTLRILITSRKG